MENIVVQNVISKIRRGKKIQKSKETYMAVGKKTQVIWRCTNMSETEKLNQKNVNFVTKLKGWNWLKIQKNIQETLKIMFTFVEVAIV